MNFNSFKSLNFRMQNDLKIKTYCWVHSVLDESRGYCKLLPIQARVQELRYFKYHLRDQISKYKVLTHFRW